MINRRKFIRSLSRTALVLPFADIMALAAPPQQKIGPQERSYDAKPAPPPPGPKSPLEGTPLGVTYTDVVQEAGLATKTIYGGEKINKYLLETTGCGQWPGAVTGLDAPVIPHMGWNVVAGAAGTALFKGLDADARFYFVHSYAAQRWEGSPDALLTWATHGVPFLAAVEDGPLAATQFHPEKSGDAGAAVLSNWVEGL